MATTMMEKDLLDLERQYWQALKNKDTDAAIELTADPCIVTGPQGAATIGRDAFAAMAQDSQWELVDFEIGDDAQVLQLDDDAAVLAYTVHEEMKVDGEPVTIDAVDSSTWVRRDGQWRCAVHTEALTGDPFGRDRVAD